MNGNLFAATNHHLFRAERNPSICRSKCSNYVGMYAERKYGDGNKYCLNEDERSLFRQVMIDSGASRGEILAMIG